MMGARRLTSVVAVSLCALAWVVLYCGAPALAARSHVFSTSFGTRGSGNGQLDEPYGVAVNESTHDVYVVDKGNDRVEVFSSAGVYIGQFNGSGTLAGEGSAAPTGQFSAPESIAVDNSGNLLTDPSAGDVYVADTGHKVIDKFSSTGSYIGQLTTGSSAYERLDGVAVDKNGTLWVYLGNATKTVESFSDAVANEFLSARALQVGGEPGFAVDSEDNLYVDWNGGSYTAVVAKLTSTGSLIKEEIDPLESTTAVAVDLSNNNLYVDNISSIGLFSSEGKLIERLGSGNLKGGIGVAIDSSSGTVYAVDSTADTVDVFELEPYSPPVVESESVSDVASTSATLAAQINPRGSSTEYRFEYGLSTSYGTSAPIPDGSIASGFGASGVSMHRAELLADTTYHYRIVVHNELGTVDGPDHMFTTQSAGGNELALPDGRAWELVSPADKNGSLVNFEESTQAASDGGGVTYTVEGVPLGDNVVGNGGGREQVLSVRGSGGWRSEDLQPVQNPPKAGESAGELLSVGGGGFGVFAPDLSRAVVGPGAATLLSPEALDEMTYLRNNVNGSFAPLFTAASVPPGTKAGEIHYTENTPDLNHFVFRSNLALTPEAIPGSLLYELSGGRWQLVSILPNGDQSNSRPVHLAGFENGNIAGPARSVSVDGRRIAWTTGTPYGLVGVSGSGFDFTGLYVRDMVEKKTVRVGGETALYQMMSSDGSRIFFLENGELYEFDMDTGVQTDLTANHGVGETSAGVKELVSDVSNDGSYVYFVATGALATGAVPGEDNLYLSHDSGGEWSTRYISTLSSEDEKDWYSRGVAGGLNIGQISSRVSPDGRYLTFMSDRSLTGYDNIDANSGQPDEEVYLYDAVADRLVCASCDPTGARPVGVLDHVGLLADKETVWGQHWLAGNIPGWTRATHPYQSRYLSDSGRLFFNSPGALVPQDTNGLADVYEYEPSGVGGCNAGDVTFSERSGGCVNLISSGTSASETEFFDASETGDDVFFITSSRLTPADYDTVYDVYDAHVCSASAPCVTTPVSPPQCTTGDSCKTAPSPQPEIFGPAPSATFSGTGNVIEEAKSVVKRKPKPKKHAKQKKRKGKKAKKSGTGRASRKGGRR
jgi:sugar lactone lactonase YvrE